MGGETAGADGGRAVPRNKAIAALGKEREGN
jgi:hypothetical protein